MQPLSYQVLPTSCWVTSMINAILYIHRGKLVPFMSYKLLHNLLVKDGVFNYTKREKSEYEAIINAVATLSNVNISVYTGDAVESVIRNLDYSNYVAVCDVNSSAHTILINGMVDGVFYAFDPYWDNVKKNVTHAGEYETFAPYMSGTNNSVNLRISANHLFANRTGSGFQMGAKSLRSVAVIGIPDARGLS